jgi:hypothetical protein
MVEPGYKLKMLAFLSFDRQMNNFLYKIWYQIVLKIIYRVVKIICSMRQ